MRSLSFPRFHALVFIVGVFSILSLGLQKFSDDPGVGWHLETGRWILEHKRIPREDPFLYAATPRPWVSDQWLSDIILALSYDVGGFPLLYALIATVFIFIFFSPLARALRGAGFACVPATFGAFFAFKIAQVHLILRPVVFGIACFCLLFCALLPLYHRVPEMLSVKEVAQRGRALILPLAVLFLFWANLHPSFFLGLIFIALLYVGLFLDMFFFTHVYTNSDVRTRRAAIGTLFFVALFASLCNPYGYHLHESILELGSSSFFMNYHQEWASPNFDASEGQMFLVVIAAVLLSFFVRKKTGQISMVDFLLIAFFSYASLDAVRYFPFLGIVVSPYVARAFYFLGQMHAFPGRATVEQAWARIEAKEDRNYPGTVFIVTILAIVLGVTVFSGRLPIYAGEYGPRSVVYPYGALQYLSTHGGQGVVAAHPAFGGFITWQGKGHIRAIIDDRNTLLGEQIYKDFEKYLGGEEGGRAYFKMAGATHMLLPMRSAFAKQLMKSGELQIAHQDEHFALFVL